MHLSPSPVILNLENPPERSGFLCMGFSVCILLLSGSGSQMPEPFFISTPEGERASMLMTMMMVENQLKPLRPAADPQQLESLLHEIAQGSQEAFEQLYHATDSAIYGFALSPKILPAPACVPPPDRFLSRRSSSPPSPLTTTPRRRSLWNRRCGCSTSRNGRF